MKNVNNKKIIISKYQKSLMLSPSELQAFEIKFNPHDYIIDLIIGYANKTFVYQIKEFYSCTYVHDEFLSEINKYLFHKLLDFNNNKEMILDLTLLSEDPILLDIIKDYT